MLPFYDLTNKKLCNMYNQHKKQRIFRLGLIANSERKVDFCSVCQKKIQGLTKVFYVQVVAPQYTENVVI